ncbi:MAG: glycosyltransferase [Phycisphaerales bacterium]|nr:glycosyltransferase [Phycisphaerales bacterium]
MIHYITPTGIASAWVANELSIVRQEGIPFVLHSLRASNQKFFSSPWALELDKRTRVLYPLPIVGAVASLLVAPLLFRRRFFAALANAIFGERESLRNRAVVLGHFVVACHWARGLRRENVSHIHSQWIHSGGTVGFYGAWLLGKTFSFTGHAADLFRERVALKDKVRRADFIVCISNFHRDLFKRLGARDEQLHIVYCGINVTHFTPAAEGHRRGERPRILSSGRLVEKKGFAYLIDACKILEERGVEFDCVIGGNGPLESELREQVARLDLGNRVSLTGRALTQEELPEFMRSGDIYTLACVWAKDDDVDGLPQMLMEAMACGLPAVSTNLVGIPDLVIDQKTGLLVEPNNVGELADALDRLLKDRGLAARLGRSGAEYVREKFEIATSLRPLMRLFKKRLATVDSGERERSGAVIGGEHA